MDSEIKHIIEEEGRFVLQVEDSKKAAREKVEQYRICIAQLRESEFNRITDEFKSLSEIRLQEIRSKMDNDLKEMREKQEHLLDDADLQNKITGRIVSVILENRT